MAVACLSAGQLSQDEANKYGAALQRYGARYAAHSSYQNAKLLATYFELSFPCTLVAYTRDEKIKGVVILETAGLNYRPTCCLNLRRGLCLYLKHSWGMIDLMRWICLDHNFLPFG